MQEVSHNIDFGHACNFSRTTTLVEAGVIMVAVGEEEAVVVGRVEMVLPGPALVERQGPHPPQEQPSQRRERLRHVRGALEGLRAEVRLPRGAVPPQKPPALRQYCLLMPHPPSSRSPGNEPCRCRCVPSCVLRSRGIPG